MAKSVKLFEQAIREVRAYADEDDVPKADVTYLIGSLNRLADSDLFLLYDALGFCQDRDELTEALYRLADVAWRKRDGLETDG